jgi:hypothetical protein
MDELGEVRRNDFNIERDLIAYQGLLGTELTEFLHTLGAAHHWVDAGAGRAQAVVDYLSGGTFARTARVTAVALHPPEGLDIGALEERLGAGFRYLHGRPIEERAVDDIGAADLITDVYGPLQYSLQIDRVMEQYIRLLKPGGRLWFVQPAITHVRSRDRELPLAMWLSMIRGLRPLRLPVAGMPGNEVLLARDGDAGHVPPLFLERVASGPPPLREYVLLDR